MCLFLILSHINNSKEKQLIENRFLRENDQKKKKEMKKHKSIKVKQKIRNTNISELVNQIRRNKKTLLNN